MDLREYVKIIQKDLNFFLSMIIVTVFAVLTYFYFQPVSYRASLTLNVTRSGIQETQDYRYDGFYRLQADERFADTVAAWLGSPRIVSDVYSLAKVNPEKSSISAQRRSSQIIAVDISAPSSEAVEKISRAAVEVVSRTTEKLNAEQKEKNWFKVVAEEPIISKHAFDYKIIFAASFFAGIFLSFWLVMLRHYLKG